MVNKIVILVRKEDKIDDCIVSKTITNVFYLCFASVSLNSLLSQMCKFTFRLTFVSMI